MNFQVLGCSGAIAAGCRTTAFLVDDDMLIDAGTGVGDLSLDALARIDHILISHSHLDHVLAIGLLADTVLRARRAAGRGPIQVHALPDKAVQALLLPLERDVVNLWIACTSRPAGSLDAALRSRFAVKLALDGADVAAVGRSLGWTDYEARALASGGDLRLALAGESSDCEADTTPLITKSGDGKPRLWLAARELLAQSIRNPAALQVRILDALVDYKDAHTAMCVQLSQRNDEEHETQPVGAEANQETRRNCCE